MKRYIIISVMLVLALGLNAQTTRGSRNAPATNATSKTKDEEKKSNAVKTETRTKEVTPAKQETRTREAAPAERKPEPAYNESRNREQPAAKTTNRTVETRPADNRSSEGNTNKTVATPRNDSNRTRTENGRDQEPDRKTGVSNNNGRTTEDRNPDNVRPQNGDRKVNDGREVNNGKNREYVPRTEQVYVEKRQTYRTPERPRTVRTYSTSANYVHQPIEYRRSYYPYTEPHRLDIIWDMNMYHEYCYLYPQYDYWYYPYGYRIHTISAYDAESYVGEIARIYGRVSDVWYERQSDEYTLYFGEPYPFQDFSVIISGKNARRYSYHPERYFLNRNLAVTGLVSLWENHPEMLIKKRSQIEIYF
jgi:hypothetical protein